MPRLHLGINTCFAVKRWPEPEQWLNIVKELGLDYCQFSLDLVDPLLETNATDAYAEETRKLADALGITIHSTFTGLAAYSWSQLLHPQEAMRDAATRWYERAIDFTALLGAAGTGGHLGAFSVRDMEQAQRKEQLLGEMETRLSALARYAQQQGLQFLLFENMAVEREWGHTIEQAQALCASQAGEKVPLVLCLDLGHPCALHTGTASDNYEAWLAQKWTPTPILHLQQSDRSGDHHWPFTAEYNRKGLIRADVVLQALSQWPEDTDLYLFLEPIHPFECNDQRVLKELRESVQYWQEAINQ